MRQPNHRSSRFVANSFGIFAAVLCLTVPGWAQTLPALPPANSSAIAPANLPVPQIMVGRTLIPTPDRSRAPFRAPEDNILYVAPETIATALGTTFTVDERAGKAYFLNNETGKTATALLRFPNGRRSADNAFIPLIDTAETLGAKCEYEPKNNILYVRAVLTSVEMLGSQLRVKGTLPLAPKITLMNGGKTVAFDFAGAEVGTLPKNLTALGPSVSQARTGQMDDNTARVVLELSEKKSFVWLSPTTPSTLAVMSSAPGAESTPGAVAPSTPAVVVTVGPDGKPITPPAKTTPAKPAAVKPTEAPTMLKGVRFVRVSDNQARIIVDAPSAPAVRTLLTRERLTLDVKGIFSAAATALPDMQHPLLQGVQAVNTSSNTAQLLIDLSRAVNYQIRLDPKGGFTVDLTLPRGAGGNIAGKLIVVDAGHGGHDSGAGGRNGAKEKNVTLAIARRLADELRDKGANVIMTRDSDSFIELGERSNIANRANADMFVSVHADSAGSSANGSTVYYHLNDASERALAECVADEFRDMGGIRTYGSRSDGRIYTSGFSVLRRTNPIAILCETGYMSNSHDVALLVQPDMQSKIARAIANGVQRYIEGNAPKTISVSVAPPTTGTTISVPAVPAPAEMPGTEDTAQP